MRQLPQRDARGLPLFGWRPVLEPWPALRSGSACDRLLRSCPRGDADGFANDGHGVLWIDPDDAAVWQQVKGRAWTVVDALDLATDQMAHA